MKCRHCTVLAADTAAQNSLSVELNVICVHVLDLHATAPPVRQMAHLVVDLFSILTLACAVLTKQTIVGSSRSVRNCGGLLGEGIGGLLKSLLTRLVSDGSPGVDGFSLHLIPCLHVCCEWVAIPLRHLQ